MQKFEIELDGVTREANLIKIINLDAKEYAVYSVDFGNDESGIYASEIVKDESGYDTLVEIEDKKIRQNISELMGIMLS